MAARTARTPSTRRRARRALTRLAFAIADQSMYELLLSHSLPESIRPGARERRFAPVGCRGRRVRSLTKADPGLLAACQWLFARGLARVERGFIVAKVAA
jgi:hypothetical protein